MRAFLGWVVTVLVSVGLGMALYSTSLKGSTSDYQEVAFTPGPTATVVKTKTRTKIVRKPAKTKVVYVPQPAPAATVYVPQQSTVSSSSGNSSGSSSSQSDDGHHNSDD